MNQYRILVIYDGKPGHLSQSLGMANLIERFGGQPCDIQVLQANPRLKLLNRLLRRLAVSDFLPLWQMVSYFYRSSELPKSAPDLIISFGGNVVALAVALKRIWKIPFVAIGNAYGAPPGLVDVHATAFGRHGTPGAIATGVSLCRIKPEICLQRSENITERSGPGLYWALLIGGKGSGYSYSEQDWLKLASALTVLSKRYGVRWLISVSRRTDPTAIPLLQVLSASRYVASSIGLGFDDEHCFESYLGAAERIFCTEDSLSMISESVAMSKPVVSLYPHHVIGNNTHTLIIEHMVRSGLLQRESIHSLENFRPGVFHPNDPYEHQLGRIYEKLSPLIGRVGELGASASPFRRIGAVSAHTAPRRLLGNGALQMSRSR